MKQLKSIYVKNIIPVEFCYSYTHILLRGSNTGFGAGDEQIPNALSVMGHNIMFETLQERLWPTIEAIVGEELLPTYSYARLYSNGDILKKHTDRPACEVSVTIQLGRSHNYSWPIYMGEQRYDLAEGDGVIYSGCDVEHWRDICDGPKDYYSGQVFLHYVRKNGQYSSEAGDPSTREPTDSLYIRNRTLLMETK